MRSDAPILAPLLAAILALILLAPGTALADGPTYDPAILDRCLSETDDPQRCIGLASATCIAGPEGVSTAGQGSCLLEEAAQWQALRLDAIVRLAEAQIAIDRDRVRFYPGLPRALAQFEAAHAAFDAYRAALCDWEATQHGVGTATGPAVARCQLEATAAETLRLRARLGGD